MNSRLWAYSLSLFRFFRGKIRINKTYLRPAMTYNIETTITKRLRGIDWTLKRVTSNTLRDRTRNEGDKHGEAT